MTRRITAICCFVFAVFILLSGCVNREVGEENTEQDIVNVFDNNLEDRLVVYATHPEPMLKRVADAFTEKTGVLVEYVSLKGDLTDRMREEKDIAKADVMYGGSSTLYIALTNEDLLEAYVPSWSKDLHSDFVDSKSYWHGVMKTPIVIFYREDLLGGTPIPTSWKDLSKPQYQGLIISRDSNSSSQEAAIVSLLSYFEKTQSLDEGISWLKDLDNNTKNYYPNNESHFKAFVAKEAPIGYGVLSAVIESKIKDRIPFSTVNPKEGSIVLTDCIALIKDAPHPNSAKAFIEFAGSEEVQIMLANEFDRMPTLDKARIEGPAWMHQEIESMPLDWSYIAKHEYEWSKMWEETIRNKDKSIA